MKDFSFFWVICFIFLSVLYARGLAKSGCLEREKALVLLETAKELLSKAKDSYPSCNLESNSTDETECGEEKSLAYIEISKKLIAVVKENFPNCSKVVVQDVKPRDCAEILANGRNESGVYTIWPSESNAAGKPLQVYCDMETGDGGWTLIQRRGKFPVQQDFYQFWEAYKNGFGNIKEEFWLGNENIRILCREGCEILFDLQDKDGQKGFAVYENFKLIGINYKLNISGYTGDAGDRMYLHNGYDFSTRDKGQTYMAEYRKAGWWHGDGITLCNLNGIYKPNSSDIDTVYWYHENLAKVEIKVRRKKMD